MPSTAPSAASRETDSRDGVTPMMLATVIPDCHAAQVLFRDQNRSCDTSDSNRTCYAKSEWRHGLSIWWAEDVTVRGLTIFNSGGDGVILGGQEGGGGGRSNAVPLTQRVRIINVTSDSNHRQGLSLINCVTCVVEDCVFSRTSGTKPMAGLLKNHIPQTYS